MTGRPPKPVTRAQGHRKRVLVALPGPKRRLQPPQPPAGLLRATEAAWDAYWGSPVAGTATDADLPAVELYFTTVDEWRRCFAAARKTRLVAGSMGQPRLNPLADRADRLAALLPKLAAEIGIGPLSRSRLAVGFGEATKTLEDLVAEATQDTGNVEDPRLQLADSLPTDPRSN